MHRWVAGYEYYYLAIMDAALVFLLVVAWSSNPASSSKDIIKVGFLVGSSYVDLVPKVDGIDSSYETR